MSQSLWGSVGTLLLKAGGLYAEHAKNVYAALQLPAAQQHERLQGYLRSLTPAQFAGFKVAVELTANTVNNPLLAHALRTVVARAERFRDEPIFARSLRWQGVGDRGSRVRSDFGGALPAGERGLRRVHRASSRDRGRGAGEPSRE